MASPAGWWLGCCLVVLGGCDSAPPSAPSPAQPSLFAAASAAAGNFELAIGTPAMHSLGVVAARMILPGTADPVALATPAMCSPGRSALLPGSLAPRSTLPPASLIADSLFRRVYAYDATSRTYQWTSAANGPANGVRFLLDDVNNYGQYIVPRTQVGWLDLTDAGAGAGGNRLRAQVVSGATVNAAYTVTPSGSSTTYTALLEGRAAADSAAFTFADSVQVAGQETNAFVTVDSAAPGVRLTLHVRKLQFDAADFRYELDLRVSRGSDTLRFTGANVTYCYFGSWDVAVTMNDSALAHYTRDLGGTTVTPGPGQALSSEQIRAITDLMDMQQLLFDWLQVLFLPAWRLLPP